MASGIAPPSQMVVAGVLDENWTFFKQKFELYLKATDLIKKSSETKSSILLSIIGDDALKIYNNLKFEEDKNKMDYEIIMQKFDDHFKSTRNVTYERHLFFLRNQHEGETVEAYANELRQLSTSCEFDSLCDSLIKDRLILGILDSSVKRTQLQINDLALEKALEICFNDQPNSNG